MDRFLVTLNYECIASDTHALVWYLNQLAQIVADSRSRIRTSPNIWRACLRSFHRHRRLSYLVEKRTFSETNYQTKLAAITNSTTALVIAPIDLCGLGRAACPAPALAPSSFAFQASPVESC